VTEPNDHQPRRLFGVLRPGETPQDWFRREVGPIPTPAPGAEDAADAERQEQRGAAISALEETIPELYRWSRFSAPELPGRVPEAALVAAGEAWRDDRLCLAGASRAGKTSLAVAMLRRWVSHKGKRAAFVHAYQLGVARLLHPAGHGEPELVAFAMRAPLVLIDDLGGERDFANSALPDILVERHAENRPTWVTTGMTRAQLVRRYGQGIVSRIFDRATVIRVAVDDRPEGRSKKSEVRKK
jgi:hypothetical protein